MLYQEYKKKMQKLVRILETIRKFRVLIIFVASSIILLTAGFLITKGMVFNVDLENESLEYGDKMEFSANAMFSKVDYEYKQGDSAWTSQQPQGVGEYKVRAVGKNIFGKKRYSKEYTFVVAPREIIVEAKEEAIGYGSDPTPLASSLAFEDTITAEFDYTDRTQTATYVFPVLSSIVITNKDGVDVTSSYKINIKQDDTIAFIKRPITITVDSIESVYDGNDLKAESFEITENTLAFEDQIQAKEYPSISDVGEAINNPSEIFVVTTPDGKDVTCNYEITVIEGLITVNPRPIIIQSGNGNFVYDNLEHSVSDYIIDESTPLVEGHTVVVESTTSITNVSSVENVITVKIYNGEIDVTANYDIEYRYGTLEVTKRDITIYTADDNWTYDGLTHQNKKYVLRLAEELLKGHSIEVLEATTVKTVTETAVDNVVSYAIYDGNTDVTENYNIIYKYGKLKVVKRPLTIKSNDESHVYDDEVFVGSKYTIASGTVAEGQELKVKFTAKIKDVGETPSTIEATIYSGDEDVTSNYNIKLQSGTLEVTKRPIKIAGKADQKVYDGTELRREEYDLLSKLDVLEKHTVKYVESASITNYGETPNKIKIEIYAGETNNTSNYDITYGTPGKLTITKRAITITADSLEQIYDGTEKSINTYVISEPGIAPNQKETVAIEGSQKNVGSCDNVITSVVIKDKDNNDVTFNYEITPVDGKITINLRPITLVSESHDEYYDGSSHAHQVAYVSDTKGMGLAPNQTIEYGFNAAITNVIAGGVSNTFEATISDGTDITNGNYDITYEYGTLTILPRPITVVSSADYKIYDGSPLTNHTAAVSDTEGMGLAPNQTILYSFTGTITDYVNGGADNLFTATMWSDYRETTYNYEITYKYGTLTIDKRPIHISTPSASKVYDGTELSNPMPTVTNEKMELVAGHYLVNTSTTSIVNVSTVENKTEVEVWSGYVDKTHNYEITYSYGELEITKRPLEISSSNETHIYDAEEFTGSEYSIVSGSVANGQILTVEFTGAITDVQEASNEFKVKITHNDTDVTENYELTLNFGKLTVIKRQIAIAGQYAEKVYDGTELRNEAYDLFSVLDVVSKHTVKYTSSASITNVGNTPNYIAIEIYEGEENKTSNYDITYLTPSDLVVTKRIITVTADSLTEKYDGTVKTIDTYTVSAPGIAPNQVATVVIEGSQKNVGSCDNVITSIVICDASGVDVTPNYDITLEKGVIVIEPRPITVISSDDEKTYDGNELVNNYAYVSTEEGMGLAPNQTIRYHFTGSITDYVEGGKKNEFTVTMWANGEETTGNYDITYDYGTLTIKKRPITVISSSDSKIYDGLALENHSADISTEAGMGLAPTQKIRYQFTGTITDYVEGGKKNEFTVTIWSGDIEKTSNYEIIYQYGNLIIDKRPIHISTPSASKVYDGFALYLPTATLTDEKMSLVAGHYLLPVFTTSITDAQVTDNVTIVDVRDLTTDEDKTHNYEITYSYGTLTITKRQIDIITNSDSKMYDGTPLTNGGYTWNSGTDYGLADGKYGQRIDLLTNGTITYVGETENTVESLAIYDGFLNVTDNYEINLVLGTLVVTQRSITITAQDREKEYDGTPLVGIDPAIVGNDMLADGDTLIATYIGSQTIPGTSPVSIDEIVIMRGDTDVTFCYYFTDSDIYDGTLTVTKRALSITANSDSKVYDGKPLENSGYSEIGKSGIADGQTLVSVTVLGSITNVGAENNVPSNAYIIDENGENVSQYYEIEYINGTLEITPRQITITTGNAEKVYDATQLVNHTGYIEDGVGDGIADGQSYILTVTGSGIDAGEYTNTFEIVIYSEGGEDVTSNYEITENCGTLLITPRPISFRTGGATKQYDGTPLTYSYYTRLSGTVLSRHRYQQIKVTGSQTAAGESDNTLSVVITDRYTGADVTHNYDISVECGKLVVTKPTLTITTGGASKVYDGYPLTSEACSSTWSSIVSSLATGHTMTLETTGTITEIGSVYNTYNLVIMYNGEDVTSNFEIIEELGELIVMPAPLEFTSYSTSKKYDGLPLELKRAYLSSGALMEGHNAKFIFTGQITNAGTVENTFTVEIYDKSGNLVNSMYPSIDYVNGNLTVEPIDITVVSGSAIKEYDGTPLYSPLYIEEPCQDLENLNLIFDQETPRFTWEVLNSVAEITNIGELNYALSDGDFQVYFDGEPVPMENFNITFEEGTLKVVNKLLVIYLWELQQFYKGENEPLCYEPTDWYTDELPEGVVVELELEGSLTEVGTLDTEALAQRLIDEGKLRVYQNGIEVTSNFTVVFEGTLTVSPCVLELTAASAQRVYKEGEELTAHDFRISKGQLIEGHRIDTESLVYYGSITDVGYAINSIDLESVKILDANGNDVTANYFITVESGILEVIK